MKTIHLAATFTGVLLTFFVHAQDATCKVKLELLAGTYSGECKNGLANGKGEAKGQHSYKGSFKDGMPNGEGIYYYGDDQYYDGSFQNGIREGKGEMHYIKKGNADSIVKGYWSGDVYRGNKYITYSFTTTEQFDSKEITPSQGNGNTVSIELSTTSGSPNGTPTSTASFVLSLSDIMSPTGNILKVISKYETAFKSYVVLEMTGFPCKLFGTLSDSQTFELELYKAANWKVRFFKNK